jgi:ribosome-binding factor A
VAELRLKRIESLLRQEICSMIFMGEIKDPRVEKLTTVTGVELSKDLGHAKIFVSRFGERETLEVSVKALNHAAGFIQGVLAKRISLRIFPKLVFILDDSIEKGFRITKKLREISEAARTELPEGGSPTR